MLELQYGIRAVRFGALFGDCGPVVHLVQGIFLHCTMIHINNQPNIMILNTCYPRVDKTLSSANNDRDHIIIIILAIIFLC